MKRALPLLFLASFIAFGCGADFEDQSKLQSLRVLGVRKDKPYVRPGDSVQLSMLYDDAALAGADAASKKRDVQILWISACDNPGGDIYLGCLPKIAKAFEEFIQGSGASSDAGGGTRQLFGFGPQYSFSLSPRIIANHSPPVDRSPAYGLEYVFFLVCAGEIKAAPADQQFPLACYSKSGVQLGADDFVVGYTAVYAYDTITNDNPIVTGFTVDKKAVTPACIDEACVASGRVGGGPTVDAGFSDVSGDAGLDAEAGAPRPDAGADAGREINPCSNPSNPACIEVCTAEKQVDCPEHEVKLETDPASVEPDEVTKAREGRDISEQAWINYYTDQGEFVSAVKLLGDATSGYQDNHGTKFKAPKKLGPFSMWGVAHDSRGGTAWAEVHLATRPAK